MASPMVKSAEMSVSRIFDDVIKVSTDEMKGVELLPIALLNSCGP